MITIKKAPVADTRTCDWSKVTKSDLLTASKMHIKDVSKGMLFLAEKLKVAGTNHDHTKISHIDEFYKNFQTGFKNANWYEMHQEAERHHLSNPKYIQDDVNLIDVLEMIVDGVMAGMARSGEYRRDEFNPEVLIKAFENTVNLVLDNVKVVESLPEKEEFINEFGDLDLYRGKTFKVVAKEHPHYGETCYAKKLCNTGVGYGLIMLGDCNEFVVFAKKDIEEV